MKKPHKRITDSMEASWKEYMSGLEQSLRDLEADSVAYCGHTV